jgi:undecaprenyl-diphosphatase
MITLEIAKVAVLALVQGAAELLPVSSSAHVVLAEKLMGLDPTAPSMTFLLVMLHTGTMAAVLTYFWPRWSRWLTRGPDARRMLSAVAIATALTGGLGLGLKLLIEQVVLERILGRHDAAIEELFGSLPLIATALATVGILIIVSGMRRERVPDDAHRSGLGLRAAALIGVAQAISLPFRGFSRSGATISVGLLSRVPRALAEDFSFALAVVLTPPVIVLELRRLVKHTSWSASASAGPADALVISLVGMLLSFVAGSLALRWLSRWLEAGRWPYFGVYCLGMAFVVTIAWRLNV